MVFVFQGETGGYFDFPIQSSIVATSGYLDVIAHDRTLYRVDGSITANNLRILKSGVCNLDPGDYSLLPQVADAIGKLYFLDVDDLQIIEVPDFFSNALLTEGSSILARLLALENAAGVARTYTAGPDGIQTAKILALQGGVVVHANCANSDHAGTIVGISTASASAGDQVPVQAINVYSSTLLTFPSTGPALVGTNGDLVLSLPAESTFVEFVGVIIGSQSIQLFIDSGAIII